MLGPLHTCHRQTPDKHNPCSKRAFDGLIRVWRRSLHQWDAGAPASAQLAMRRRRVAPMALGAAAASSSSPSAATNARAAFMSPARGAAPAPVPALGAPAEAHQATSQ
jgi:hypothetical protein